MCLCCFKILSSRHLYSKVQDWSIAKRTRPMWFTVWFYCLVIGWNCPGDGIIFATNQHEPSTVCRHITIDLGIKIKDVKTKTRPN